MSGSTMMLVGGLAAIFIGLVLAVSLFTVGHRVTPVERGIATIGQAYSPIPHLVLTAVCMMRWATRARANASLVYIAAAAPRHQAAGQHHRHHKSATADAGQ